MAKDQYEKGGEDSLILEFYGFLICYGSLRWGFEIFMGWCAIIIDYID